MNTSPGGHGPGTEVHYPACAGGLEVSSTNQGLNRHLLYACVLGLVTWAYQLSLAIMIQSEKFIAATNGLCTVQGKLSLEFIGL